MLPCTAEAVFLLPAGSVAVPESTWIAVEAIEIPAKGAHNPHQWRFTLASLPSARIAQPEQLGRLNSSQGW
jgi:hypothetical protein